MIDLTKLIESANELPCFPASTLRLTQLVTQPNCNLADVVELITYDQALTVKILRAANSAASASVSPVTGIQGAVMRMGTAQMMALAVASGARCHLQKAVPAYGLEAGALWRHAVAAAVAAEVTPAFSSIEVPPEVFTAALLHDIGKQIMGRFLSEDILLFLNHARNISHLSQLEAETLMLGVHHGELGGLIAQHWKLPDRVVDGITHHHDPGEEKDVVCDFVFLANAVAKQIEPMRVDGKFDFACPPDIARRVGILDSELTSLCQAAAARLEQVSLRYNAV